MKNYTIEELKELASICKNDVETLVEIDLELFRRGGIALVRMFMGL